ncbi:hypothetical protein BDV18DRAFT_130884 [Aspergillus unguis]
MPPTRTSSVSVTTRRRSTRLPRVQSQPGISSFARTTKPGVPLTSLPEKDGKSVKSQGLPVSPSKKRKLHELENVECIVREREDTAKPDPTLTPSKSLKFSSLSVSSPRPRSGHYATTQPSTASADLSLPRAPRSTGCESIIEDEDVPATPTKRAASTATTKPKTTKANSLPRSNVVSNLSAAARPACVEELVRLHSAFLKALTIHAAHRGIAAPADLREFLPSVERIWKKRKVVVKDLQRLLWIWKRGGSAEGTVFRLANHGLGRVCLERVTGRAEGLGDEAELQRRFEDAVDALWEKFSEEEKDVDFLGTVGLQPIEESLTPFTAFKKGQQRLQDLKGGVIKVKMGALLAEASEEENLKTSPATVRDATTSRRQDLLERIKSKTLRQAKLPPPPSKEALLRRAAAGRVEEVAGVLALLRPAGYVGSGPLARMAVQRTPFCLETIVRNVQDSTRNPISEKEVEACLEILSREDVAGHWVSIVPVNKLKSVVLRSCGDVQLKDLPTKVAQLQPGWEDLPKVSK